MSIRYAKHKILLALTLVTLAVADAQNFVSKAQAADVFEAIQLRGTSNAESAAEAAREIQSKELSNLARELARNLVGEQRFQAQRNLIEGKIIREASRFFPFVQPDVPKKQPDGTWLMNVSVQYAPDSLRQMLVELGLFNSSEVAPVLLPLITVTDRDFGQTIRWWSNSKDRDAFSEKLMTVWDLWATELNVQLVRQGFLSLLPRTISAPGFFPPSLRAEPDAPGQLRQVAAWNGASLVLRGEILMSSAEADQTQIQIEVLSALNGKLVSQFSRMIPHPVTGTAFKPAMSDAMKDFSILIFDAWSKGRFAVNTYRLVVRGPETPQQVADFKADLVAQLKDVREVRERFFESGQVTFEIDTGFGLDLLKERFKQGAGAGMKTQWRLAQAPSKSDLESGSVSNRSFVLDVSFKSGKP